jgi:twitching motility protein PilJ
MTTQSLLLVIKMAQTITNFAAVCAIAASLGLASTAEAAPDLATEMSLQLSRYMIAILHSSQGNAEAARQLGESTNRFNAVLDVAIKGGQYHNCTYAPAPQSAQNEFNKLGQAWAYYQRGNDIIQQNRQTMQNFTDAANAVNLTEPQLLELSEQVAALVMAQGGTAANVQASSRLVFMTERLDKSTKRILLEPVISPEVAFLLGKDTNEINDVVPALINGSPILHTKPVKADAREKLQVYEKLLESNTQRVREVILKHLQEELMVKMTITEIDYRSEAVFHQIQALAHDMPQGHDCH